MLQLRITKLVKKPRSQCSYSLKYLDLLLAKPLTKASTKTDTGIYLTQKMRNSSRMLSVSSPVKNSRYNRNSRRLLARKVWLLDRCSISQPNQMRNLMTSVQRKSTNNTWIRNNTSRVTSTGGKFSRRTENCLNYWDRRPIAVLKTTKINIALMVIVTIWIKICLKEEINSRKLQVWQKRTQFNRKTTSSLKKLFMKKLISFLNRNCLQGETDTHTLSQESKQASKIA